MSTDLTIDFHLLGEVPFGQFAVVQQRLADAAASGRARSIPVLLCEHPRLITIGRQGSRAHIRLSNEQLQRRGVAVEWVARGGGCVPHGPGQLCIYPIISLFEVGWTVGQYLRRLQQGISHAITSLNLTTSSRPGSHGVWGHSGLLSAMGVQVKDWVTHYGVYLNVAPEMGLFGFVDTADAAGGDATMSCLVAERRGAVNMSRVRSAVIASLSDSFGATQHHIHAGHPWLNPESKRAQVESRRAI